MQCVDGEGPRLQHGEKAHQGGEQAMVLPYRQAGTTGLAGTEGGTTIQAD